MFVSCCDVSRDPEMRQKMLTMMSQLVTNTDIMNDQLRVQFQKYAIQLLKEVVLPNCVWVSVLLFYLYVEETASPRG